MKQFNIGDKVQVKKFGSPKLGFYMGIVKPTTTEWHMVCYPNTTQYDFVEDEEITLAASAEYIPIAKFHKGDFAAWIDNVVSTVMILEDRNDKMQYKCYQAGLDIVMILESELRAVGDNA